MILTIAYLLLQVINFTLIHYDEDEYMDSCGLKEATKFAIVLFPIYIPINSLGKYIASEMKKGSNGSN